MCLLQLVVQRLDPLSQRIDLCLQLLDLPIVGTVPAIKPAAAPIATLSSPRGLAHPCVYRGFCVIGCSTNAKQSVLVTWIARAIESGYRFYSYGDCCLLHPQKE